MYVYATSGHVDHGKSTLVDALTTMDPDRWAEEKRRGLTIDLGFAWTTLESGVNVAFVDVPGHERFIANTLAGLGPAPAGSCWSLPWMKAGRNRPRSILRPSMPWESPAASLCSRAWTMASASPRRRCGRKSGARRLPMPPSWPFSAHTGEGIEELRAALDAVLPLRFGARRSR